ncbi:MAG: AlkZ family DNA glycosylase [Bacteroidales bacterium]|nr:AlkZ family DNA glycosylase [Bacteroidales bacterium]
MSLSDIANFRLINQQITNSEFKTPKEIVGWMGAIQAQDMNMAKWAIGARLNGSTEEEIDSAIEKGEIIRIHLLRPTWHFVSSEDIYWMLDLTSPQIRTTLKSRDKRLGHNEAIYRKSNAILEKALSGGNHLSREELIPLFINSGLAVDENKAAHLLLRAEIDGLICSGKIKEKKQTYALLSERVSKKKTFAREEALAELAKRYFTSHGPATLQDFIWWSGLSIGESKQALEMVKSGILSETVGDQTYWFAAVSEVSLRNKDSVYLLPAYDEFVISYRDRTASLIFEDHNKAVSNNGVFRPIIVEKGIVTGIWKRTIKNDKVMIETEFFRPPGKVMHNRLLKPLTSYGHFLEKKVELNGALQ